MYKNENNHSHDCAGRTSQDLVNFRVGFQENLLQIIKK